MKKFRVGDRVHLKEQYKYGESLNGPLVIQKVLDNVSGPDYLIDNCELFEEELEFYRKFKIGERVKHVDKNFTGVVTSYEHTLRGTFVQLNGGQGFGYFEKNLELIDKGEDNEEI